MKEILYKNISTLPLEKKIIKNLSDNEIDTIMKLCNHTRLDLSELGFSNNQINDIIVQLQLIGLDLKKNHAKRNTLLDSLV